MKNNEYNYNISELVDLLTNTQIKEVKFLQITKLFLHQSVKKVPRIFFKELIKNYLCLF